MLVKSKCVPVLFFIAKQNKRLAFFAVRMVFSILHKRKLSFIKVNLPKVMKQVSDGCKTHSGGRKNQ